MEIKTKFNVGDKVCFIKGSAVAEGDVCAVRTEAILNGYHYPHAPVSGRSLTPITKTRIFYEVEVKNDRFQRYIDTYSEELLFATKAELLASL